MCFPARAWPPKGRIMKYILAVDDEPLNRDIIEETLSGEFEVLSAASGTECMARVFERIPDMILVDYAMPDMDGVEVCKRLRADERTNDIPILMLSGYAAKEHIETGMAAGANYYITKPFVPSELLKLIRKIFNE